MQSDTKKYAYSTSTLNVKATFIIKDILFFCKAKNLLNSRMFTIYTNLTESSRLLRFLSISNLYLSSGYNRLAGAFEISTITPV